MSETKTRPAKPCAHCGEPMLDGEKVALSMGMHDSCATALLVGGLNHQLERCSCYLRRGYLPPDPPSLSLREAARVATIYFHRNAGFRCEPDLD